MPVVDQAALEYALLKDAYSLDSLGSGLGRTPFFVYYQPITSFDGRIGWVEALLRYRYERALLTPGDFIPLLESVGIFGDMAGPIIDQVLLDSKTIHLVDPTIRISINFSNEQLSSFRPAEFFRSRLQRVKVPALLFGVEVSEHDEIPVDSAAYHELLRFATAGHPILLDDYGIGYSNLSRLTDLPASVIKLDKKFLANLRRADPRSMTIVGSVVQLAHALDLKIIGEGVETKEQLDVLRGLGCDYYQGFYLARPMPLVSFVSLLQGRISRRNILCPRDRSMGDHDRPSADRNASSLLQELLARCLRGAAGSA